MDADRQWMWGSDRSSSKEYVSIPRKGKGLETHIRLFQDVPSGYQGLNTRN